MQSGTRNDEIVRVLSKGLIEPKVSVVGCGGAGNNVVHSIYWSCKNSVETVAVNTDESKLEKIDSHKKILIGKDVTHGKGAGGFPEVGEHCAECARAAIKDVLKDSDIVFIVAGMGGGTGTGAAPVVAEVARDLDAVTFAIAINPFSHEKGRQKVASAGIKKLRESAGTTIVLDNDQLLNIAGDVTMAESFCIMERSITKIIDSVCNKITESFITEIAADVEEVLQEAEEDNAVIESVMQPSPVAEIVTAKAAGDIPFPDISPELISR